MVGAAKQILVVEDDKAIMETLSIFLKYEGFRVLKAASVEQALNILDQTCPDMVLLDYMLQDDTAEPVVKLLREKQTQRVPVLLLTAADNPKEKGKLVDADAVIAKPFELETLLQHLLH